MSWRLLILLLLLGVVALPVLAQWRRKPVTAQMRQQAEGEFATLSQGITHYSWTGPTDGPVAVCIHGLTTPSFVWRDIAQGLAAQGYHVLTYDLYGRGFSDAPKGLQDHAFFLRQLNDLLDDQGVQEPVTVLGYSMGGALASAYAATQPERVNRLILLASAGMQVNSGALAKFIADTPVIGDWLMLALYPRLHRTGIESERSLPGISDAILSGQLAELDKRGFVPAVLSSLRGSLGQPLETYHRKIAGHEIPVHALWGADDDLIPLTAMDRLADWNPKAQQNSVAGAGHGLPYSHSEEVLSNLLPSLSET